MDLMNRGVRPHQGVEAPHNPAAMPRGKFGNKNMSQGLKLASMGLLFSVAVVVASLVAILIFGSKSSQENKYVQGNKLQAVFLNGGQVYFGNILALNNKYLALSGIYYLRVNQQVQPKGTSANNNVSLVKLGCELHGPEDKMVINRDQVIFWENLKDDGQVAKAVAQFKKDNPNGQNCAASTSTPTSNTP